MTANNLIKQLLISFNNDDKESFITAAREYIEREKKMKHNQVAKELEKALFGSKNISSTNKRFKNSIPIPRDSEKGFPLLEVKQFNECFENLFLNEELNNQLIRIIKEFNDSDILATYNLDYKKKILLCGKPGTGKTFTTEIISSVLNIPLVYVRFDSIVSSYLGETASNLRKVFDFIENGTWIVLFDEFDIIGKNRDDIHEHGEIKRVVNNFLQMLDNFQGDSILFAATNHQYLLDPAIWRRFDEILYYELPESGIREKILNRYLKPLKKNGKINLKKFVEQSEELSPADIKMIAEDALKNSIINGNGSLNNKNLEDALKKFKKRQNLKKVI